MTPDEELLEEVEKQHRENKNMSHDKATFCTACLNLILELHKKRVRESLWPLIKILKEKALNKESLTVTPKMCHELYLRFKELGLEQ